MRDPLLGKTVSHYQILARLGEGGMGVVYEAEDTRLHRRVALKFLASGLVVGSEAGTRFLREARSAAALNHPNVTAIYDLGDHDGRPFLAMELVTGDSLDQRIARGPVPPELACEIAISVGEALRAAHASGIIHRDIKSSNILLAEQNDGPPVAKLTDFGIARSLNADTQITREGATLGTVAYMAPEQFGGGGVDHRADLWSLGVVIFEMFARKLPFAGASVQEVLYSILHRDPPSLIEIGVPESLDQVVRRSLSRDPANRFADAGALVAALRAAAAAPVGIQDTSAQEVTSVGGESRSAGPDGPSIAVLPFQSSGQGADDESFADGMTEDIITSLSGVSGLRVATRGHVFRYKGETPDLRELGRTLDVDHVLMGSVRRAGDRVRITVGLSKVSDGYETWSERFDRVMKDIFEIQDEISEAVAESLRGHLVTGGSPTRRVRYTANVEAYNHYLKGRYYWDRRSAENIRLARQSFEQALACDDDYALAHTGLADCRTALALTNDLTPTDEVLPRALQSAIKALRIDPTLPEAHTSLAFATVIYELNWAEAEAALDRAIELSPEYSVAWFWQAIFVYTGTGRFEEAADYTRRALELDPVSPTIAIGPGLVDLHSGRYEAALVAEKHALELDPDFPWAHLVGGRARLALGDYGGAEESLRKCAMLAYRDGFVGVARARAGDEETAREILASIGADLPVHLASFQQAAIHCALGEADAALDCLERAIQHHAPQLVWLDVAPELRALHDHPRWPSIRKAIGRG